MKHTELDFLPFALNRRVDFISKRIRTHGIGNRIRIDQPAVFTQCLYVLSLYIRVELLNIWYDTTYMRVLSNTERERESFFPRFRNAGIEFLYWFS